MYIHNFAVLVVFSNKENGHICTCTVTKEVNLDKKSADIEGDVKS